MMLALLTILYTILLILCARQFSGLVEEEHQAGVMAVETRHQALLSRKKSLVEEKKNLEEEAHKIFTLYEMTKDITKSLSEQDAFAVFKAKLNDHVNFEECLYIDSLAENTKQYEDSKLYYIFDVQGKNRRIGHIILKNISSDDHEKVNILGHQFALALRRVHLYQEIEKIAITDSLTGLHTRRYTVERLTEEINRSKTRGMRMSFLMIDVDYFKSFNDRYGHLAGDQILREIGKIIRDNIREIDIAGRFGGEEFCVVLPDTDQAGAQFAAERIRSATEQATIQAYDASVRATVSVGIATYPQSGQKRDELIDKADWALYRAKKKGRNMVCSFGVYKDAE